MRNINNFKFRLYNKVTKQMFEYLTGFVIDWDKNKIMIFRMNDLMPDGIGNQTFALEEVALMQFTGLQDKNGVDIYEGYILKIDAGFGGDRHYESCITVMEFVEGSFLATNKTDKHGIVYQDFSYGIDTEIIGNIHENPELLKDIYSYINQIIMEK